MTTNHRPGHGTQSIHPRDAVRKALNRKTPETWAAEVKRIPARIRAHAASVIWWDFFGGRTSRHRLDHLDQYLTIPYADTCTKPELIAALMRCGYSEQMATSRLRTFTQP